MTNFPGFPDRKCETCFYCEKHELPNFDKQMLGNHVFKQFLPDTYIVYKCHIQGPPVKVNLKYDWCHQWELKND
jgi:hypothetical protein